MLNNFYYFLILTLNFGTIYMIDYSIYSEIPTSIWLLSLSPICPVFINIFFNSRCYSVSFYISFWKYRT
nr:MAG TPA: hypothetical protein [Bacteriophage sp.]